MGLNLIALRKPIGTLEFNVDEDYDKDYTKRYSNETMLEFYQRWHHTITNLKNSRYRIDWETEHFVIYVSC